MPDSPVLIDKSSPIPAYHQIASDIIERVNGGEWKLGDRLPSEAALALEYGVSRLTLRQALSDLESRGLITRMQGKGAYLTGITKPFVENLNFPILGYQTPERTPDRSENRVLALHLEQARPAVREIFHMAEGDDATLVYLRRLFVREGRPLGLNHAWFPPALVPGLVEEGLVDSSITATLDKRYHYQFAKIENFIEASTAGAMDAALLECPYGSSLLKIQSTYSLADGTLIEHSSTLWLGNLTRFHLVVEDR